MLLVCRKDRIIRKSLQHFERPWCFFVGFSFRYCFYYFGCGICFWPNFACGSRPRQVKDVAHQEEVVRTLTNTLETGNVSIFFLDWVDFIISTFMQFVQFLRRQISDGTCVWLQLPHLLFYGPPGTGKTTTGLAICHQLFGWDIKEKFLHNPISLPFCNCKLGNNFFLWEEKFLLVLIRSQV